MLSQFSRKLDAPPCTMTVTITIIDVVVSIACLASETVFRIANANDMAPLKPTMQTEIIIYASINKQIKLTSKKEHMLKVSGNLRLASEIQQER